MKTYDQIIKEANIVFPFNKSEYDSMPDSYKNDYLFYLYGYRNEYINRTMEIERYNQEVLNAKTNH